MKILVVSPSWVGDTVMMEPMLARLHALHPAAEITVMAPDWSRGLLSRLPGVANIIANPFPHGQLQLAARRRLGHSLRGQFERAYILPNSLKSALVPAFARIPHRIGFIGEFRFGLLTDARKLDRERLPLMVERFATLAEPRGSELPRPVKRPELISTPEQQAQTRNAFALSDAPALALCPGAEYGSAKRWPEQHFAAVARAAIAHGWQVWIMGAAKDAAIAETIRRDVPEARSFCGATTLEQAIDLLAQARQVITNDSGLMHVACAVGAPTIALYGSSSPGFTPPLSEKAIIESLHLDCSPCFERECPYGHRNCLELLAPENILRHIHWQ